MTPQQTATAKETTQRRRLDQQRAQAAWEAITKVKGQNFAGKYEALARGAAADIQMNGLGQTLAFWRAKGQHEHRALYEHLSAWVSQRLHVNTPGGLMDWIVREAGTDEYRRATTEALAFLMWLKRFAEAELGGGA